MLKMRSALTTAAIVAALMLVGSAQAGGPVTKQNGSSPVLNFTPICAVAGYADYGLCGGSTTTFSGVGGRLNAIQPKLGTYNFEFLFSGLTPATEYKLLATRNAVPFGGTWVEVGRAVADAAGAVTFSMVTTDPVGLGFDLNRVAGDITITTSWWSGQKLVKNADTTLSPAV
jgi:hypothetical protein